MCLQINRRSGSSVVVGVAAMSADGDAPALTEAVQPEWVTELFAATKTGLAATTVSPHISPEAIAKKKDGSVFEIPLYMIDVSKMPHEGYYPLEGTVKHLRNYYWPSVESDPTFPPRGLCLEIGTSEEIPKLGSAKFFRLNLCNVFLGWLMRGREALDSGIWEIAAKWKQQAASVPIRLNIMSESQAITKAYSLCESEEKNAERMGHSPIERAKKFSSISRALNGQGKMGNAPGIFEVLQNVPWGTKESALNVLTIRTQIDQHFRTAGIQQFHVHLTGSNAWKVLEDACPKPQELKHTCSK